MKNTVQSSSDSLDISAPAPVRSGDLVAVGDLAGVAIADAPTGALVTLSLTGIYRLPKAAGIAVKLGEKMYAVAADKTATNVAGTPPNPFLGFAAAAAVASDAEVQVLLSRGG